MAGAKRGGAPHNTEGKPVGVVVRWDRPGGKDIRPVSRNGEGWIIGGMPGPRPLYRLPDLADAKRVYVCEGEKAADAARSIGLIATTSPHGSKSADGRLHFPRVLREKVYRHLIGTIRRDAPNLQIGLCLEEPAMFDAVDHPDGVGRCNCVL